jgi:hypothetical protein
VCTDFADLYHTYDEMRARHGRELQAQGQAALSPDPEIRMPLVDGRRCVAVYTFYDDWQPAPAFAPMHQELQATYPGQNVYTLDPRTADSTLHFTILQVLGFEQFADLYAQTFVPHQQAYLDIIQAELDKCLPFTITYRGLMPIKTGLIMVGFPSIDLAPVREGMERAFAAQGLPYRKYMNNIVHSTIMRLVGTEGVEAGQMLALGARYADTYFGTLTATRFEVGVSSWRMQERELQPLAQVGSAPKSS